MKKIFSIFLLVSLFTSLLPKHVSALSTDTYFVVTAYYSPLPDQKFYLTWDYESEKRLNGQWIAWASGKEVFSGMLAAPKNYQFGTKIYLKWLGIGSVEDRWWAIVNAGKRWYEYDRIDVWVGSWDEGLRRALYWWKRKVEGKILDSTYISTIDYTTIPAPLWATKNLKSIPSIFSTSLWKGSDVGSVTKLQKFLEKIWLYSGAIDGIYNNEVIDIVYNFQVSNGILQPDDLYGAWYWGQKTRALFLKKYMDGEFDKIEEEDEEEKNQDIAVQQVEEQEVEQVIDEEVKKDTYDDIFSSFTQSSQEVKKLQKLLMELSLYDGDINGNYSDVIDPIFDFQISQGVISSQWELGAWSYGPKTRAAMKAYYNEFQEELRKIAEEQARLEELKRLEEEKKQQEELRKKQLEEKIQQLEEFAQQEAQNKIASIWEAQQWEVWIHVRNLQNILKDLWYFHYNDTAIFWPITSQSVAEFQFDHDLIDSLDSQYAGIVWPRTKQTLQNVIAENILHEQKQLAGIDKNEI